MSMNLNSKANAVNRDVQRTAKNFNYDKSNEHFTAVLNGIAFALITLFKKALVIKYGAKYTSDKYTKLAKKEAINLIKTIKEE